MKSIKSYIKRTVIITSAIITLLIITFSIFAAYSFSLSLRTSNYRSIMKEVNAAIAITHRLDYEKNSKEYIQSEVGKLNQKIDDIQRINTLIELQ